MYLAYFEQIVLNTIKGLNGPSDWALPYWNYSDASNANARKLPQAFRDPQTPDGVPNPLRVAARNPGVNAGSDVGDAFDVDLVPCLTATHYAGSQVGSSPGFGGPQTGFSHSGGSTGVLEAVPHGSIHVDVGGWMGRFETAALDPIFWLHHANIDRLWVVWRNRDQSHVDPTQAGWLNAVAFDFHDASGKAVTLKPTQVVDTTAPPLGYRYEDTSDPLGAHLLVGALPGGAGMDEQRIPEMVGATETPVHLTGDVATTNLSVRPPTGPARPGLLPYAAGRAHLNIENVTGEGAPTSYGVYLNLPKDAKPEEHPELFAGILPMFGVAEASKPDTDHAGDGLHYALDISDLVRRLQGTGDWNPANLRVTFVPRRRSLPHEEADETQPPDPIHVGRVSLYYE